MSQESIIMDHLIKRGGGKNVQPVLDRLSKLEDVMAELRSDLLHATSEGNGMRETVKTFKDTNDEIYHSLHFLERNVGILETYARREREQKSKEIEMNTDEAMRKLDIDGGKVRKDQEVTELENDYKMLEKEEKGKVGDILRCMGDEAQSLLTTFKGINKVDNISKRIFAVQMPTAHGVRLRGTPD